MIIQAFLTGQDLHRRNLILVELQSCRETVGALTDPAEFNSEVQKARNRFRMDLQMNHQKSPTH